MILHWERTQPRLIDSSIHLFNNENLQNMHAKSLPPTGARARLELDCQDWARLQGRGPHTGGPKDRLVGWRMW